MNYKFTIFTPVYNGDKVFHRVANSVKNQTYTDFEWIIINDGSTDDSDNLIVNFIKENPQIHIKYSKQKNLSKAKASEIAVKQAKGELFIPADQDDTFESDTLQFFYDKWQAREDRGQLSGVTVLCKDELGGIVGDLFPEDEGLFTNFELNVKYVIGGEKWGCVRTDIYRSIDFNLNKSKAAGEFWWYQVTKSHKMLCCNKALRVYYKNTDGMSATSIRGLSLTQVKNIFSYKIWLFKNYGLKIWQVNKKEFFNEFIYKTAAVCYLGLKKIFSFN